MEAINMDCQLAIADCQFQRNTRDEVLKEDFSRKGAKAQKEDLWKPMVEFGNRQLAIGKGIGVRLQLLAARGVIYTPRTSQVR
jgi:hypothetical protein